ncbi:MAG: DNA primase [Snowella sp.]|nr:MAG: DNA primase [Snowella sp.]
MEIPRLHPDTIEAIKERVDIVDVISEYVVLKKKGKDYSGLCPFHDEKSPSFSVSPTKQVYYCFGCGQGGNTFKFLMELGKRSFGDVVLELANRYQVPIKTLEPEQKKELQRQLSQREQLYEILAVTTAFYQHVLYQPQGEKALNYLKEKRGLKPEIIQQFELGYSPEGWETLYRYLVEQKHYPLALVEQAGLIKPRKTNNGYYDQFRDRLMIPIQDIQGRVIGFGSRTLGTDEPKYLNSPETPLFEKGKTLFGLDKAKNSIQKQDQAIVVEGYFDVIALHAAGFTHAIAALGTAFSKDQLKLLLRYTDSKQVIFNFDADKAGTKATQRAIGEIEPLIYSGQVNLRVLNLPEGKDADEFLKSSSESIQQYQALITQAPLWFDWQIQQLLVNKNLKQADHFEQVGKGMIQLLKQLEDSNQRAYYLQYCAEILSQGDTRLLPIQVDNLLSQLKNGLSAGSPNQKRSSQKFPTSNTHGLLQEAEILLLQIYLHCPECRAEVIQKLEEKDLMFSYSHHRFLWQKILEIQDSIDLGRDSNNRLFSLLQDVYLEYPEQMKQVQLLFHLSENDTEDIFRASMSIPSAIAAIEKIAVEQYSQYCLVKWQEFLTINDLERSQYYYQECLKSKQEIEMLNQQRIGQNPT